MMRDCIQMYIKYSGPCQKQNSHKLTKNGYLLHSIPMESKTWNQNMFCNGGGFLSVKDAFSETGYPAFY